jgi:hypothetical protein
LTGRKCRDFEWVSTLVGGLNPSEKYESQWEGLSHILWNVINVPNHQPEHFYGVSVLIDMGWG